MNDSSNTQSESLSGGGTRVSFGIPSAEAAPLSSPPTIRLGNEQFRWTAGGSLEKTGITKFVHNPAGESGGDIMSSRLRSNGHDTVCFEPGNEATRVQFAFALREGLIREVAAGVYEDASRAQPAQLPGQPSTQPLQLPGQQGTTGATPQELSPELQGVFSAAEDAAWQAEFADVPEPAFNAAVAGVVNATVLGGTLESAAATLARETGMDPAEAAAKVANGAWAQRQIVDRALANIGMQADQLDTFYESARNNPSKLQDAIFRLLHGRDVSAFQRWGQEWLAKGR